MSWLTGGVRARELNETRAEWKRVERVRASSALSSLGITAMCARIAEEAIVDLPERPSTSFFVALGLAAGELLDAEDIEQFEPKWSLIEADAAVAVEFREALVRLT